jgi:hypothetical protein
MTWSSAGAPAPRRLSGVRPAPTADLPEYRPGTLGRRRDEDRTHARRAFHDSATMRPSGLRRDHRATRVRRHTPGLLLTRPPGDGAQAAKNRPLRLGRAAAPSPGTPAGALAHRPVLDPVGTPVAVGTARRRAFFACGRGTCPHSHCQSPSETRSPGDAWWHRPANEDRENAPRVLARSFSRTKISPLPASSGSPRCCCTNNAERTILPRAAAHCQANT